MEEAKKHLEGEADAMKEQIEKINQIAHKLAESIYSQTSQPGEGDDSGDAGNADATEAEGEQAKNEDDVVDAEFEDIGKK